MIGVIIIVSSVLGLVLYGNTAYGICHRTDPFDGTILDDTDCDGLADTWEMAGNYDYNHDNNPDLTLTGANWQHKDIYIEVDFSGYHTLQSGVTTDVTNVFLPAPVWNPDGGLGVNIHFITGQDISSLIPGGVDGCLAVWSQFDTIKASKLGLIGEQGTLNYPNIWNARNQATHYALSVDTQCAPIDPASSGNAEIFGNDLILSLGGPGWGTDGLGRVVGSRAEQAAAIVHELGHNLNLRHGGNIDTNCKPNYISAMSYTFEFPNPPVSDRILDYSRSTLNSLNENAGLSEPIGIIKANPTTAKSAYGPPPVLATQVLSATNNPINWNRDNPPDTVDTSVTANINNLGTTDCNFSTLSTLYGYTDWLGLIFWGSGGNFVNITLPGGPSNESLANSSVPNVEIVNSTSNLSELANSSITNETGNITMRAMTVSPQLSKSINSSNSTGSPVPIDPPPCDPQDPSCPIVPCNPMSPACTYTPCDPDDPMCVAHPRPSPGNSGPEFTVTQLHELRQGALEAIDFKVAHLPDAAFNNPNPSDVVAQKQQAHNQLIVGGSSVSAAATANNMENQAIVRMTQFKGFSHGILRDTPDRTELIAAVDNFINALQLQK